MSSEGWNLGMALAQQNAENERRYTLAEARDELRRQRNA